MSKSPMVSVCLLIMLISISLPAHGESIPLATGEWIPYTSSTLEHKGRFTQRVTAVLQEMALTPDYHFYPWRRCFDSVIKGRVWAAFPYAFTPERAEKVWFSDPISCSRTLFFYYDTTGKRKIPSFSQLSDLRPYRLGGVTGYYYEEMFQRAGLTVEYVTKEVYAMEKLIRGRIDLMPVNEQVAQHLIHTSFPQHAGNFKTIPRPLTENTLHLIVSKQFTQSRLLLEKFNATLRKCIAEKIIQTGRCEQNKMQDVQ